MKKALKEAPAWKDIQASGECKLAGQCLFHLSSPFPRRMSLTSAAWKDIQASRHPGIR